MDLTSAQLLSARLIETGETHVDYQHTVDLAETYKIFITGTNIEKKLFQFVQRESVELFKQRVRATKSITPAVASSIQKPFFKVSRNNRVRKNLELKNPNRMQAVTGMIQNFYGSNRTKNRGLDYWLKNRFPRISFIDPNSWVVVEWETPKDASQVVQAHPFVVSAAQAINFLIENEETQWLFVKQAINYLKYVDPANKTRTSKNPGVKFTLYDKDFTVVYEQVDKDYIAESGYVYQANEQLVEISSKFYIQRFFQPKIGYVPSFRVGYIPDPDTDDRTFVNPFHEALPFFYKSLKTVSEFDLTMMLHAFPQKLQYVQKCPGEGPKQKCDGGWIRNATPDHPLGRSCTACKGTGFKIHTTTQDVLLVPMPEEGTTDAEVWDLSKMIHYEAPPIDLVKFQNEYIQQLKGESHEAVFNSQVFVKKAGSGSTQSGNGGDFAQTATAEDNRMDSVYDTLEPYTEKMSEVYKEIVTMLAIIAGESVDGVKVTHVFPANPKLKTPEQLIQEIAAANASGAPSFMRDTLTYELAENVLEGDELGFLKYQVKDRFFPFSGKGPDEIAALMSSQYVSMFNKVFYANFESVFMDIELEEPGFFLLKSYQAQADIVKKKVQEYIDAIAASTPDITINALRGAIAQTSKPTGGENPANDDDEDVEPPPADGGDGGTTGQA